MPIIGITHRVRDEVEVPDINLRYSTYSAVKVAINEFCSNCIKNFPSGIDGCLDCQMKIFFNVLRPIDDGPETGF